MAAEQKERPRMLSLIIRIVLVYCAIGFVLGFYVLLFRREEIAFNILMETIKNLDVLEKEGRVRILDKKELVYVLVDENDKIAVSELTEYETYRHAKWPTLGHAAIIVLLCTIGWGLMIFLDNAEIKNA